MHATFKYLFVLLALLLNTTHAADKKAELKAPATQALPAELSKWIPWLEATQAQRDCPKQNDQAHCLFPSSLKIDIVSARELRFELRVLSTAHAAEKMALPGAVEAWPQAANADPLNGGGVENSEAAVRGGFAGAPRINCLRPTFLQWGIVEKGVGSGVENFMRERRRFRQIARDTFDLSLLNPGQQRLQAIDIHRFGETILDGLGDENFP